MARKASNPKAPAVTVPFPSQYRPLRDAVEGILTGKASAEQASGTLYGWMREQAEAFPDATIKAKGKKGYYIEGLDAAFDAAETAIETALRTKLPGTWKALKSVVRGCYVEGIDISEMSLSEARTALKDERGDGEESTGALFRRCIGYATRGDYSKAPEVMAAWAAFLPHAHAFSDAVLAYVNADTAAEAAKLAERTAKLNAKRNPRYSDNPSLDIPSAPNTDAGRAAGTPAPVPDNVAEMRREAAAG